MLALDVSDGARLITPEWCAARKAEGYGLLWVDGWTGNHSPAGVEHALELWHADGSPIGAYYAPHAFRFAEAHFTALKLACGAQWSQLRFVAIDVEDIGSGDPMPSQWTTDHLRRSVELLQQDSQRAVFYSSHEQWQLAKLGADFRDSGLINANYNVPPDLGDPHYGGWTACVGHQYQNTTDLDGIAVDISLFDDRFIGGNIMTPDQRNALDVLRGFSHDTTPGNLQEIAGRLRELDHPLSADAIESAAKQLRDASDVLDATVQ